MDNNNNTEQQQSPPTIPAYMQVFMAQMQGMMDKFAMKLDSNHELLSERMKAMADKQAADVEALKAADRHNLGNLKSEIQQVVASTDKRLTKHDTQIEEMSKQLATRVVGPSEKDVIDTQIQELQAFTVETKTRGKVILAAFGGVVTAIVAIIAALIEAYPIHH